MSIDEQSIRQALEDILSRDPDLKAEIDGSEAEEEAATGEASVTAALATPAEQPGGFDWYASRYRRARPVTTVERGRVVAFAGNAEGRTWQWRLAPGAELLRKAINAVGRIEVEGNGDGPVAGTGFLIRENVIATNAHVAAQFAEKSGSKFVFRLNVGGEEMEASIDFLEEAGGDESLEFEITGIFHFETDNLPDVAFLEVAPRSGRKVLPEPLEFYTGEVKPGQFVVAIGYPERDTREKHARELEAIFGDVFGKKRVSPGEIRRVERDAIVHDCSVLRGSSGSPMIDVQTGKVVGIHSKGEFLEDNFAVPAPAASAVLDKVVPSPQVPPIADAA